MRLRVEHFIENLNKKKFDEKKWIDVDYYGFNQITDLIQDRYHIVFTQPEWRSAKIEQWDLKVEELVNYVDFDDKLKSRKLICSYREDICRHLEKIYIYIINRNKHD